MAAFDNAAVSYDSWYLTKLSGLNLLVIFMT